MTDDAGQGRRAIVLAAGDLDEGTAVDPGALDLVIAADGGLAHAISLGLMPDLVIGDLDSADPSQVDAARDAGAEVEVHPTDKVATDLELALDAAVHRGATDITVVGVAGGRPDHHVANLLLLTHEKYARVRIVAIWGAARLFPVHHELAIQTSPGALVTLLAVGAPATSVRTEGLRWALDGDTLAAGTSRGVSNVAVEPTVRVRVGSGTLLAIVIDEAP